MLVLHSEIKKYYDSSLLVLSQKGAWISRSRPIAHRSYCLAKITTIYWVVGYSLIYWRVH